MMDKDCYLIDIPSHREFDGVLSVMEGPDTLPFDVKRVFWVHDTADGAVRGNHATINTKLVLVAVSGSFNVTVDDGREKNTFHLDNSEKGLFINNMIWRSMSNFKDNCVVMAFCDRIYACGGVLRL